MPDAAGSPPGDGDRTARGGATSAAEHAVGELEARLQAVRAAALEWGVRPEHLEGRYLAALLTALHWLGRLVMATVIDLKAVLQAGQAVADAEVARLHAANDLAALMLQQTRGAQRALEIQRETVTTRLIEHIGPQLATGIKDWLVIRETAHNRKAARRRAAVTSAVVIVLISAGYALRAWQDDAATEALTRCLANTLVVTASGETYCNLKTLLPQ